MRCEGHGFPRGSEKVRETLYTGTCREQKAGKRQAERGGASPAQWAELPDLDSRNYLILQYSLFYVFCCGKFQTYTKVGGIV